MTAVPVISRWLVNGRHERVDPADRGLAYGDGLFETMAARDGQVRRLALHFDRLAEGCRRLGIPMPALDVIRAEIGALCPQAGPAVVKLIVTRGVGSRGYAAPEPASPTRIVAVSAWPDYSQRFYDEGIAVRVCGLRLGESAALAGLKHLNRLEQVLAQLELKGLPVQQGLLLDTRDHVVGGTSSNVFVVAAGRVSTPALETSGIKGVMRRAVIAAARELGLQVEERPLTLPETFAADEVFMTNALFGIWPVAKIDSRDFAVGPVTRRLLSHFGYDRGA